MSDKPVAGLVAAVAIAPVAALCCLGPAVLGSAVAWVSGWFSGLGPVTTTALAIVVAVPVIVLLRRSKARRGRANGGDGEPTVGMGRHSE